MIPTKTEKTLLAIPLIIISVLLVYCWIIISFTDAAARWQHILALGLFAASVLLYLKSFTMAVIATGSFLLLATCNVFSLTPSINTTSLRIGPLETPAFNLLSLGLLVLYLILNFGTLVDLYLDHKEAKRKK